MVCIDGLNWNIKSMHHRQYRQNRTFHLAQMRIWAGLPDNTTVKGKSRKEKVVIYLFHTLLRACPLAGCFVFWLAGWVDVWLGDIRWDASLRVRGEFSGAVGNLAVVDWQVGTVRSALNLSTLGYLNFGIFGQCKSQIWPRFVSSKEILFSYAKGVCVTHTQLCSR